MADAETIGPNGGFGPEMIRAIHERIVAVAQEKGVIQGRRMRLDITVVETNIHYPTDSSLLGNDACANARNLKDSACA